MALSPIQLDDGPQSGCGVDVDQPGAATDWPIAIESLAQTGAEVHDRDRILITYVQNLRIEEAKRLLEGGDSSADDIAALVGYENPAFFRLLFKRATGLTPGGYRRMFQPLNGA
jgi:AraC-like DNA-binding protein